MLPPKDLECFVPKEPKVPEPGSMWVAEIWRYPVKSMAGERVDATILDENGVAGDRALQVYDAHGRILTARTKPRLLMYHATMSAEGSPVVDGRPWDSREVAADVIAAAGKGARLFPGGANARFDVLPLLVATDGAIAALGRDRRRLRPNLVIGGVPGLAERDWAGRTLVCGAAGQVLVGIQDLRQRCVMTTWDPDTLEQDVSVLRRIYEEFGGAIALNARVLRGGTLAVGDTVRLAGA